MKKKISSKFLSTCSLIVSYVNGFLGGYGLLGILFVGLTNPVMYGVAAGLGAFNALMIYSGVKMAIRNRLGLPADPNINQLLLAQKDEIYLTEKVNTHLLDMTISSHIKPSDFKNLSELTKKFNSNIEAQKKHYLNYPEKTSKKIVRYLITGIGGVLSLGSGLSMMHFLFATFGGLALLTTPFGSLAVIAAMVMTFTLFATLNAKNMFNFINPDFQVFNEISNKLKSFNEHDKDIALDEAATLHSRLVTQPPQIAQPTEVAATKKKSNFHTIHDWKHPPHVAHIHHNPVLPRRQYK